jgi:hypothetical protein
MVDVFENYNPESPSSRVSKLKRAVQKVIPQKFKMMHSPEDNMFLSAIWVLSGLLSVLIPLIYRTIHKNKYRAEYMKYYWEQEYEQYEEQRQENYEKYGNQYNYGGAYTTYNEKEYVDVNNCKWWQLNCFSFFVNQQGEPQDDQEWAPTWYSGFMTTEEERQMMQDNLEQPGSLKFVYIWQILMFAVIGYYGLKVIRENRNPTGLIIALLVWSNFAFLSMWLMADGSIVTDGQEVKRTGFYGQMSVLVFMSNFWYFIHGLAFVLIFWIRSKVVSDEEEMKKETKTVDSNYNAPLE